MHRTNYSGLAPEMLEALYRRVYLDRLTGTDRIQMITMVDILDARLDGGDVVLTLVDRKTGARTEHPCDVVLLGTGFVKEMPRIVRDIAAVVGLDEVTVSRAYRLNLPPSFTATCHLQGVNEATHGIADSLLSVVAIRAEEIVADLLAHRQAPRLLASTPSAF
jgi:L-ornithine N5-oxygenase